MAEHVGMFGGATPGKGGGRLDYYAIVAGAIAALHEPSAEARQAVYEHARRVVLNQLHTPPGRLSKDRIARERRALERAIQVVEGQSRKRRRAAAPAKPRSHRSSSRWSGWPRVAACARAKPCALQPPPSPPRPRSSDGLRRD